MPNPIPPSPPNKKISYLGVGLVVPALILVLGAVLLIGRGKNNNPKTPSVAQIQETFEPPQSNISTISPTSTPNIRGPQSATVVPQTKLYTNLDLGFQIQLTLNWQVKPLSASEIILAENGGQKGTIETYGKVQDGLNVIKLQLQNSPSIKDLSDTTFQNQPAIAFTTSSGQQGLAVIYKNTLYYIMGQLTTPPLSSFQFLQNSQTVGQNSL